MARHVSHLSVRAKRRSRKIVRETVWVPKIRKFLRAQPKRDLVFLFHLIKFEPKNFVLDQIREVFRQKYRKSMCIVIT